MTRWIWLVLAGCLVVVEPDAQESTGASALPIGKVHTCAIRVKEARAYWTICFANDDDVATFETETMDTCAYNGVDCDVSCSTHELWLCVIRCPGPPLSWDACNASYGCYCPPE